MLSSYMLRGMAPDERLVYAATLHWIIYSQGLMFTIAGGLLGFFAPNIVGHIFHDVPTAQNMVKPLAVVALVLVAAGIALLLGAYVRQASTELVVTNFRVVAKYGFISRETFEIMIGRVTGVNFDQTIWGRLFGFGTIIVHGAGSDISPIDLIANPQEFHNQLMVMIEHARRGAAT